MIRLPTHRLMGIMGNMATWTLLVELWMCQTMFIRTAVSYRKIVHLEAVQE